MALSRTLLLTAVVVAVCTGCHAWRSPPPKPVQLPPTLTFPYCQCDRTAAGGRGPYSMTKVSETPAGNGGTEVCYNLITVNADATGGCTRFDLRKIEFDVAQGCRGAVSKITFNGDSIAPSFAEYPQAGNAVVFKITKGGKGLLGTYAGLSAQTNKVCLTLKAGDCSTTASFIKAGPIFFSPDDNCCVPNAVTPPAPPPITIPPPRGPFPYCQCTRKVPEPTYSLEAKDSSAANTYCWDLLTVQASGSSCVNYDLKKIEFNVGLNCRGAVDSILFDGKPVGVSFAAYPKQQGMVFKVTRGSTPLALHDDLVGTPTELCITLRPNSDCPTLNEFCKGKCQVAFFSTNNRCCPLQLV